MIVSHLTWVPGTKLWSSVRGYSVADFRHTRREHGIPFCRWLWVTMWLLRIELEASGRAAVNALNRWSVSLVSPPSLHPRFFYDNKTVSFCTVDWEMPSFGKGVRTNCSEQKRKHTGLVLLLLLQAQTTSEPSSLVALATVALVTHSVIAVFRNTRTRGKKKKWWFEMIPQTCENQGKWNWIPTLVPEFFTWS